MTAIPEVKPVVTGKGMNLMSAPMRKMPNKIRNKPASKVHRMSPLIPKLPATPAISTTNAPVGPPI